MYNQHWFLLYTDSNALMLILFNQPTQDTLHDTISQPKKRTLDTLPTPLTQEIIQIVKY